MEPAPFKSRPLTFREKRILYALVTEYIATGEPVSSRTLSKKYDLNLSPASVRSVLSDLEEGGLLLQPHKSAGRKPTDAGFRQFIDALAHVQTLTDQEQALITRQLLDKTEPHTGLVRRATALLSDLTGSVGLITTPNVDHRELREIRLMELDPTRVLAVIITRDAQVQNRVIHTDSTIPPPELLRLNNYLSDVVPGKTLDSLCEALRQQTAEDRGHYRALAATAADTVQKAREVAMRQRRVFVEGQDILFERPEFSDPEKIKRFMRTFRDKERLLDLLDRADNARGVEVLVGEEARLGELTDVGVVSTSYTGTADPGGGRLAVMGTSRMDYGKVVPIVRYTAKTLQRALESAHGAHVERGGDDSDGHGGP